MKRLIDIIGATVGCFILIPFLPLIALAIKLDSRGPTLVKLKRVSAGKIIHVYKFRSMIHGAHRMKPSLAHLNERRDGPFFKITHDPRVTRVGKYLRRCRLDEWPQLINVFTGELSLVGPRPHEPEEVEKYPSEYRHIGFAKAGITGLSQINGASSLPFLKELEWDRYYLQNHSLRLDIKIIAKTIWIAFVDRNAV